MFLGVAGTAFAQDDEQLRNPVFSGNQWINRVIVMVGDEDDPFYIEQLDLFNGAFDGLADRSVIVVRYEQDIIDDIERLNSGFSFNTIIFDDAHERRYMHNRLGTEEDQFSVTLVGLDGQVKQTWLEVVQPSEIFDVIDAMPMRQREIEAREEKKSRAQIRREKREARKERGFYGNRD